MVFQLMAKKKMMGGGKATKYASKMARGGTKKSKYMSKMMRGGKTKYMAKGGRR